MGATVSSDVARCGARAGITTGRAGAREGLYRRMIRGTAGMALAVAASAALAVSAALQGGAPERPSAPLRRPAVTLSTSHPRSPAPGRTAVRAGRDASRAKGQKMASSVSYSGNWAGYVIQSATPSCPGSTFTSSSGSWKVMPAAVPDTTGLAALFAMAGTGGLARKYRYLYRTDFAQWVGLSGDQWFLANGDTVTDTTLAQCGTESIFDSGSVSYTMWYEFLPHSSVTVGNVRPGDRIYASVSVAGARKDSVGIFMEDERSGQVFSMARPYRVSRLSAEVVLEEVGSETRRPILTRVEPIRFGWRYTGFANTVTLMGITGGLQQFVGGFPKSATTMSQSPYSPVPYFAPTVIGKGGSFSIMYVTGDSASNGR